LLIERFRTFLKKNRWIWNNILEKEKKQDFNQTVAFYEKYKNSKK